MGHMNMDGSALSWQETAPLADQIRHDGIKQFARVLHAWQDRPEDQFKWGDELEFIVLSRLSSGNGRFELNVNASKSLSQLNIVEGGVAKWNHEFGSFMVEGTPLGPFTDQTMCLSDGVEESMRRRREALKRFFGDNHLVVTMPNYPLLGANPTTKNNTITNSQFVNDNLINQTHPRFGNLAKNIRDRRGSIVSIHVPVYKDTHTTLDDIYMDAMTFGMGCCCLQLTFQSRNMMEARHLFDQFVVLAPIALALSAASPVYRGLLSDIDCRWRVVSGSVDDRTEEERDDRSEGYISKSRYASISRYLNHGDLNDIPLRYNQRVIDQIEQDFPFIDEQLKMHLAHLFIRDPLVVYDGLVRVREDSMEHFNNLQSTNWQTVRFKPPTSPVDGWRVEFRPMDIQFTDKENAAFAIWSLLFARVVRKYNLDFCIPISLVDENMEFADQRDAVNLHRFWFKINGTIGKYSMEVIVNHINAKMYDYVQEKYGRCERILEYLQIVSKRANGSRPTNAKTMRDFMLNHADYKKDSVVSQTMSDDFIDYLASLD